MAARPRLALLRSERHRPRRSALLLVRRKRHAIELKISRSEDRPARRISAQLQNKSRSGQRLVRPRYRHHTLRIPPSRRHRRYDANPLRIPSRRSKEVEREYETLCFSVFEPSKVDPNRFSTEHGLRSLNRLFYFFTATISTGSKFPCRIPPRTFCIICGARSPISNCKPKIGGPPCAVRAILRSKNSIPNSRRPRS